MYLDQNIKLNLMADAARKKFDSTDKRLEEIEGDFHSKMRGRTMIGIIGSFFGTAIWVCLFGCLAYNLMGYMNNTLLLVTIGAVGLLMVFMLIDDVMNLKYYGKVSSYGTKVSQLRSRVRVGSEAIPVNTELYMKTKDKGWDHNLEIGESISDEATVIEGLLRKMASLRNGFINSSKTGLFFTVAVLISIVGGINLFPTVTDWLDGFFDLSENISEPICWVALIIACIIECIIAKAAWSATDCNVNNLTVFSVLAGPLVFIALVLAGSAIVGLIIAVVTIILYIAALVIGVACAIGMVSGG